MIKIRFEEPRDIPEIYRVNRLAFGRTGEADLVNSLRNSNALALSLVAENVGAIVGHIAFSPVTIESENPSFEALGLGPMAVLPNCQRTGIGSQLMKASLKECEKSRYGLVVVLGHPDYYPRFGFAPASQHEIIWEGKAPDEAFMVRELKKGELSKVRGIVKYRSEFNSV